MFALTSGVMRNDLFVFKIIIQTPDCWEKRNFINDSRKRSNNQKKTFACALQSNALTKLKIF